MGKCSNALRAKRKTLDKSLRSYNPKYYVEFKQEGIEAQWHIRRAKRHIDITFILSIPQAQYAKFDKHIASFHDGAVPI